ncbi:NADH:ubiquinone reductase (Na(+)-transporting) subunit F [Thiolapillus brandeum]|uniref:Phenol hydroxylase, ferredoxin subunit n=1 Tax=Thiolapillus brandeum TaxID=1076588 RepID=A0A7U6GHS5_9GAMM|nr:phenol 2-monooxygenase domain-containing protein [Thiolapillus brandeum]BAO43843.1 phenol hydroxylase, ferredoxin subunit [Thiolapillus brandeum]
MTYEVTIEPLGETIEVEEDQTLLDAALRAGIYLPYACGHGLCSTCKIDVLEGEVDQGEASPFALMDFEREEGKCLACCARPTSDLVIEADVDEDSDARRLPVRDFTAKVSRIDHLTPRIKSIVLAIVDDEIEFQAGQYVNLFVPGLEEHPRAFSIANPPSESTFVELNVALVEGGAATTWLHEALKVGDTLRFSGPFGRFFVRKSAPEPMIFLAGGSGLSSPKSMILDLFENGEMRDVTLIYGARNQDELYYRELFEELAKEHSNFRYVPALSEEPEDSGWEGERGYVHEVAEHFFNGRFEGHKAYLCGPPPMIDACVTTLMKGRLFERDMFMENFYTQANKDEKPRSPLFKSM